MGVAIAVVTARPIDPKVQTDFTNESQLTLANSVGQMSTADARNATSLWILNFDLSASDAAEVAGIVAKVTHHNARRKPELWNATVYSNGGLYNKVHHATRPAFFQLVHHPVQATYTLADMWLSAGMNNLRASQARISANDYFDKVSGMFEQDYALEVDYHSILDGKWDHMMDQTHVMYYCFVECDGAVSIEAAHASRNTFVEGIHLDEDSWPWTHRVRSDSLATRRERAQLHRRQRAEHGGNVTVTAYVSPSMNGLEDSRPLGLAFQIDGGEAKTSYFVPATARGQTVPAPWGGKNG
ncbi:hypothetical protein C8Q80DRAFT_1273468 [Daedaleopsis nitida]|nr:hypothetical protein C8Q80DRAFT_1273468 [Daedaleopsis nitida]